jgi:xylan 1,4-beta-xylosidase
LNIDGRSFYFEWSDDGDSWQQIGPKLDTSIYSDEYCKYGEFTGTMVGVACIDRMLHSKCAEFDFIDFKVK